MMENKFKDIVKEKPDEVLLVMVYEFDQWNAEMLGAVRDELSQRNLLPADIDTRRQCLIEKEHGELSNGRQASLAGQIFGWLGCLGLFGLIIGYQHAYAKTRSKYTGKAYFTYDEPSRENGSYIFYTACTVTALSVLYKLITLF